MPLKIYCRNCVQYRDEWCKVISDSPDPDLMRDCGFYRDKTLFNLDKVKVNKGMKEVNGYNPSKDPRLINCKTECGNERCFAKRYGLFAERTCPNFVEPKLQTNADRIRAMTDEKIEKWFWWMHKEMMRYTDSRVFLHDWLKQEVTTNSTT